VPNALQIKKKFAGTTHFAMSQPSVSGKNVFPKDWPASLEELNDCSFNRRLRWSGWFT
jgi:hypothetical protein